MRKINASATPNQLLERALSSVCLLAEFAPEQFAELTIGILAKLIDLDKAAYDHLLAKVLEATMQASGMRPALERLTAALEAKDLEQAKTISQQVGDWVGQIERMAAPEWAEEVLRTRTETQPYVM